MQEPEELKSQSETSPEVLAERERLNHWVERARKLHRLRENPEFKDLILKDYLGAALERLSNEYADAAHRGEAKEEAILSKAWLAHMQFKRFLDYIDEQGQSAQAYINTISEPTNE